MALIDMENNFYFFQVNQLVTINTDYSITTSEYRIGFRSRWYLKHDNFLVSFSRIRFSLPPVRMKNINKIGAIGLQCAVEH